MGAAPGDAAAQMRAEVPTVPRSGDGALTQDDIDRVLSDDSPDWARLRARLARFRYCEPCQSWRSGAPTEVDESEELACWVCGAKMGSLARAAGVA